MSDIAERTSWPAVLLASAGGFGLLLSPPDVTFCVQTLVRDGAYPGLRVLDAVHRLSRSIAVRSPSADSANEVQAALLQEREELERRCRALQSINAQLAEELEQVHRRLPSPFLAEAGTPLFVPELIEASIIGAEELQRAAQRVSYRRVVDAGAAKDLVPSDFVVTPAADGSGVDGPLIDQGDDRGIRMDQPVFAGRCVVGKVGQVGRWTSTVVPVTDSSFRGQAQLVRTAGRRLVLGADGVLAGDGQGRCRLLHIPSTEPVTIGDEVYTSSRLAALPVPMFYGRVISAQLPTGAPHWEITVQPAATMESTRVVHVLRSVLNRERIHPTSELAPSPRDLHADSNPSRESSQ